MTPLNSRCVFLTIGSPNREAMKGDDIPRTETPKYRGEKIG